MKPETFNCFMTGLAVGYAIRHFFPPREIHTREWVVSGIIIFLALCLLIWINFPSKDKKEKSNSKKHE